MARHIVTDQSEAVALRTYAPQTPVSPIPVSALREIMLANPDASAMQRRRFGRSISADMIERVLKTAARGNMRDIADLSRECIFNDNHLAGVVRKRFGALASLPWEIRPAEGPDVDKAKAKAYAAVVRAQLTNLSTFRDFLQDLSWALWDGRAAFEFDWDPVSLPSDAGTVSLAVTRILWIHPRRLNFGKHRDLYVIDESGSTPSGAFADYGDCLGAEKLRKAKVYRKYLSWCPRQFGDYQEMEGIGARAMIWSFFKRFAQRDRMQLLELFGKPWRVGTADEESNASPEDFEAAKTIMDSLGATYSAMFPRGINVDILKPGDTAGKVHDEVIRTCNDELSKLVLGQTGTTDNMAGGLNTSQANVMQDEQLAVLTNDARAMSEVIEDRLTDGIVETNFGSDALPHAPRFILRSDLPPDRKAELERLDLALKAGLEVEVDEAYEISGLRRPEDGATVVRVDQPPTPPLSAVAPAPRPAIVFPPGESPPVGEQQPAATTAGTGEGLEGDGDTDEERPGIVVSITESAKYITVNEARQSQGLGPLLFPDGTEDPNGYLTIYAYEQELTIPAGTTLARFEAISSVGRRFPVVDSEAVALGIVRADAERYEQEQVELANRHEHVCAEDSVESDAPFGTPEQLIAKGQRELWAASKKWAAAYEESVDGLVNALDIYNAMSRASESQDLNAYARPLERRMRQGAALGILDNAVEVGQIDSDGELVENWTTLTVPLDPLEHVSLTMKIPFVSMPFQRAMRWFRARGVMTRAEFEKMTADIKKRTFTVAAVQSQEMLRVLQAELAHQVGIGGDIRNFSKFMKSRLAEAGMIPTPATKGTGPLGASHIENVYRTNMANAYHAGRAEHAQQPTVMRARPIWEWRTVRDARTRRSHLAAHGKMLYASDPMWQRLYPPAGWQCRCSVISRDASYANQVGTAADFSGLPDRGFTSGISSLI